MGDFLISLENVGLSVPTMQAKARSLLTNPIVLVTDLYLNRGQRTHADLLKGISLTVRPGDKIAVLGRNGAGKSTLLRLIGRVYEPSYGEVTYEASTMGFFSTQNGILPQATGLENIYLRGLELGLSLGDIRKRIPDIVEFSELDDVLQQPVYTYSAGMQLRLAVAITFSVQPEVLLLDEWIGAGDAAFRDKITNRLNAIIDRSQGLMLASHNHGLLERVCNRAIVLSRGEIVYEGSVVSAKRFFKDHQTCL